MKLSCEVGIELEGTRVTVKPLFSERNFGDLLRIAEGLRPDFDLVVAKLNFNEETGQSRSELEDEITSVILGTVLRAQELKPNVLRATLKEIARKPELIENAPDHVLDLMARDYHRGDGEIGISWVDLYGKSPANHPIAAIEPKVENVVRAATEAVKRVPAVPGRPPKTYQDYANERIAEIFRRSRGSITRKFALTSVDGELTQRDAGAFHALLEVVFAPFNNHFPDLRLSFDTMVEKAIELQKPTPGVFPINTLLKIEI